MNNMNQTKLDRFCWVMTSHRKAVLFVSLLVSLTFGIGILSIKGEVILQHMFPFGHPYLQLHAKFSQVFGGGGSGVVIAVKSRNGDIFKASILQKLQAITEEVTFWEETYRALTSSIASRSTKVIKTRKKGEISIEPLMWPEIPETDQDMERLKKDIFSNPAYNGTLVSNDGSAALIITEFKENISYERVFHMVKDLMERFSDEEISIHTVGFPILMGWIYSYKTQIVMVFGVSILLMLVILLLIFRNLAGLFAPLAFSLMCTLMGIGFIGWIGINFSPLLYVLAFLVGARMVSHSVQITHRYFEELSLVQGDAVQACYGAMRKTLVPNLAGVTTDAAGFMVLIFAKILLMMQIAVIMSFWMVCIGLCGILTPILCSLAPVTAGLDKFARDRQKMGLLDKVCLASSRFSLGKGRNFVLIGCVAALIFCGWQTGKLSIGDPSPGSPLLFDSHPFNRDQDLINHMFDASSENFMLFYEGEKGSVYDPMVLNTFEAFDRHMKAELPDIYKTSGSLINMEKMVNVTFHDGDLLWYQTPRDEILMTALMGYIRENVSRSTLDRFVDAGLERAQITLFFADHTSRSLKRIKKTAEAFFDHHPMTIEKGRFMLAGGRIGLEMAVNDEMKRSHFTIDAMVFVTIFILCALFFRSMVAGLMLTFPLVLANLVAFAYMASAGIGLSINTLPVAAVGVGVGVDFAIYIYSRMKWEFPLYNGNWYESILMVVRTSGKAVVYTGFTMILPIMTWYFISDLKFQAQMGVFLAMIMATNVVLAITLHPLLIYLVKPKFIQRLTDNSVPKRSQATVPEKEMSVQTG